MIKSFKGIVNDKGELKIFDNASFKAYIGEIKPRRVIISIEVEDPKSSVFSKNYYYAVICPAFIEIFKREYGEHNSKESVTETLLSWCPATQGKKLEELSQDDLNGLIKYAKMIAGKEFDYYIND
jgi:hypothetical protein